MYFDIAGCQKITHGRIDIFVGPGNNIAGILEHASKGGHTGAADTHDVNVAYRVREAIKRRK